MQPVDVLSGLEEASHLLALASRILADKEVCDSWGHISIRHPRFPKTHFLLSRSMPPAFITSKDIVCYKIEDCSAVLLEGEPQRMPYKEIFIHGEIYKRFSEKDVGAALHFHSWELIPFGVAKAFPFKAVYHKSAFLGTRGAPVFDMAAHAGPKNDLLVTDHAKGKALATSLDSDPGAELKDKSDSPPRSLVLMRGHGSTTVAANVKACVYHGIYAKENAKILSTLLSFQGIDTDEVAFLGEEEVKRDYGDTIADRAWGIWASDALVGKPAI